MNFQFTPSQMALRDKACWFAESELKPMAAKWDEEELFPKPMVARAAELGFAGRTSPKEHGGGAAGPSASILRTAELAQRCASTAEVVFDCIIGPIQVI